jgi:hypothetical protein
MKTTIELAREAGIDAWWDSGSDWRETFNEHLKAFEALVRADERGRMCEQPKECSSEKSTSNEANRSEVLGEGGQAN